jgi:hypothetical protein
MKRASNLHKVNFGFNLEANPVATFTLSRAICLLYLLFSSKMSLSIGHNVHVWILQQAIKTRLLAMRVTDVAAGGGAPQAAAPAAPHAEDDAAALPSSGLAAAVLRGPIGGVYRALEPLASMLPLEPPTLPQVVILGQESSGKSSVLESLAMLSLFPRERDVSPRLPVLLKLRQMKMRLVYSDGREPLETGRYFSPHEAAKLMRQWTEQIARDEKRQGVVDHVLELHVHSPHVPDLDLVDLPGIVAGQLPHEPPDMMQRTRAVAEKFLTMPNTLVLAVVPASERARNSQAFQLVQQFQLQDRALGVLTMVDRALDETDPRGPLAEVTRRLDGSSRDVVALKHGYVAVKNRDTRASPERFLEQCREEETWLEEHLPGFVERGLASSAVLTSKLAAMLAEHARATWVPAVLAKVEAAHDKYVQKLADLGPDAQSVLNDVLGVSPSSARKRMLELTKPIVPELLRQVDEEMLRLAALVHADFLQSRDDHELIFAPFDAKKTRGTSAGSLVAASMLVLDSRDAYVAEHLVQIVKNVVLHVVQLVQKTIAAATGPSAPRLDRFTNLHLFFAGVLWERLNELLMEEDGLAQCLEKSFLAFDPEQAGLLRVPRQTQPTSQQAGGQLQSLALELETYLHANGFQNAALDEVFLPPASSAQTPPLTRYVAATPGSSCRVSALIERLSCAGRCLA